MLKGKVICVTGGASGLGQGICSTFAKFGAIVVIIDMNKDAGLSFEQKLLDDGHDVVILNEKHIFFENFRTSEFH